MAQAKKKQSTKTAKKSTAKGTRARSQQVRRSGKTSSRSDRNHVYAVTAMSLLAGILLCANAAILSLA